MKCRRARALSSKWDLFVSYSKKYMQQVAAEAKYRLKLADAEALAKKSYHRT